jgi:hypothetical protein
MVTNESSRQRPRRPDSGHGERAVHRIAFVGPAMLAAVLLASRLAAEVGEDEVQLLPERRRAVQRPAPPSHIMIGVNADEDLRYTNHGTAPGTVRTCIERTNQCLTDILAPGHSVTKNDAVRALGREQATLEIYSTQPLEARAHYDSISTTMLSTERQNIPHMNAGQTLIVYTQGTGSAELHTLGNNGVRKNEETITLQPGTNTIPLTGTPRSLGDQYDLLPTVPTIAVSVVDGVQHRAKRLDEARGVQYLLGANDETFGFAKNPDPTSILSLFSMRFASPDQTFANNYTAINWGTTYVNNLTNTMTGTVLLQGLQVNNINQPFLLWSATGVDPFSWTPDHVGKETR